VISDNNDNNDNIIFIYLMFELTEQYDYTYSTNGWSQVIRGVKFHCTAATQSAQPSRPTCTCTSNLTNAV